MKLVFAFIVFLALLICPGVESAEPITAEQKLAVSLYMELANSRPGQNLFFSPTNISLALAMSAAGAGGSTQAEMARALQLGPRLAAAPAMYHQLLERWKSLGASPGIELRVACRLWGQAHYPIRPEFLALTREQYGAEMATLDFTQAEQASGEVNQWIAHATNLRITHVVSPHSLDASTRLVLTNAIFFKGEWQWQFHPERTRREYFVSPGREKITSPMMHGTIRGGYVEANGLQVLEMAYTGNELSMVILLPSDSEGLPDLEASLSAARLMALISVLRVRKVDVSLPSFRLDDAFSLNRPFESLGIKRAFSKTADFSGISAEPGLHLSDIEHKAYVDVSEQGTEAADADIDLAAGGYGPADRPPSFRANHPFLFLIRDRRTGNFLFMGRLIAPPIR